MAFLCGLDSGSPLTVEAEHYPEALRPQRASFVTVRRGGQLRGCVGSLEPVLPLVASVAVNAFKAAFGDPRFPALTRAESSGLEVHISALSPLEPLLVGSRFDLLATRCRVGSGV